MRRGAFTISELLLALGVLGLFAAAATQLFHATFRISHATAQQQDAAASFDAAVAAMRDDAWVAGAIAVPDPATARLGKVTWSIKETTLTRDAGGGDGDSGPPRKWPAPQGMTFAVEGDAVLVLRVAGRRGGGGDDGGRGGDVRMISQSQVLSRMTAP